VTPARRRVLFAVESGTDVRLVEGLAAHFDVDVFCRRIVGGVEVSRPPSRPVDVAIGPPSRARFAPSLARRILRTRPDFVLVQGYALAALAANVARRLAGIPSALLVCSPVERYYRCRAAHRDPSQPFRRHELAGLQVLARLNAALGARYVVLSDHLAGVVRGHGARSVEVIPVYGVDPEVFRPPDVPRASIRRDLGLPESGQLLFFSSRIAPEKDADTLLRALGALRARGADLWLVNRSGGWRELVARAHGHGVADRVLAADAVHPERQLPRYYQAADVCVQASREEGLGFSPLEALACGTPVVAAAVGGLVETIRDGATGWTYPAGDVEALASSVLAVLGDEAEAARRAAAGRALVCERYATRRVFGELAASIERAIAEAA
jgi:glycosyltransferase involved in cell wall biosynthesis